MTPQDLAADLRTRINPQYAAQLGTESYERRLCAEAIEELIVENNKLREALAERDAEIANLEDRLRFVERWAVHHANKPGISAENALGCIAHYPPIKAITKSYADGVPSSLPNPYEIVEAQRKVLEQALEALKLCSETISIEQIYERGKAITAIQEVLK